MYTLKEALYHKRLTDLRRKVDQKVRDVEWLEDRPLQVIDPVLYEYYLRMDIELDAANIMVKLNEYLFKTSI